MPAYPRSAEKEDIIKQVFFQLSVAGELSCYV